VATLLHSRPGVCRSSRSLSSACASALVCMCAVPHNAPGAVIPIAQFVRMSRVVVMCLASRPRVLRLWPCLLREVIDSAVSSLLRVWLRTLCIVLCG